MSILKVLVFILITVITSLSNANNISVSTQVNAQPITYSLDASGYICFDLMDLLPGQTYMLYIKGANVTPYDPKIVTDFHGDPVADDDYFYKFVKSYVTNFKNHQVVVIKVSIPTVKLLPAKKIYTALNISDVTFDTIQKRLQIPVFLKGTPSQKVSVTIRNN